MPHRFILSTINRKDDTSPTTVPFRLLRKEDRQPTRLCHLTPLAPPNKQVELHPLTRSARTSTIDEICPSDEFAYSTSTSVTPTEHLRKTNHSEFRITFTHLRTLFTSDQAKSSIDIPHPLFIYRPNRLRETKDRKIGVSLPTFEHFSPRIE